MSDSDLQARIDDLESEVQTLGRAVALLAHALDPTPERIGQLTPQMIAGRKALAEVRTYILGGQTPSRAEVLEL